MDKIVTILVDNFGELTEADVVANVLTESGYIPIYPRTFSNIPPEGVEYTKEVMQHEKEQKELLMMHRIDISDYVLVFKESMEFQSITKSGYDYAIQNHKIVFNIRELANLTTDASGWGGIRISFMKKPEYDCVKLYAQYGERSIRIYPEKVK